MPRLLLRVVESRANCGEDLVTEGRLTFCPFFDVAQQDWMAATDWLSRTY